MKIGVVILNYNGWTDTLACVESVLANEEAPSWVIIVDDASPNDSVAMLRRWAAGTGERAPQEQGAPACCPKPLPLVEIVSGETPDLPIGSVMLLRNTKNIGYAPCRPGPANRRKRRGAFGRASAARVHRPRHVHAACLADFRRSHQRPGSGQ